MTIKYILHYKAHDPRIFFILFSFYIFVICAKALNNSSLECNNYIFKDCLRSNCFFFFFQSN